MWRLPNTVILLTAFQEESVCKGPGRGRCKEGVWEQTIPSVQTIGVTLSKFCLSEMIATLSESKKPRLQVPHSLCTDLKHTLHHSQMP